MKFYTTRSKARMIYFGDHTPGTGYRYRMGYQPKFGEYFRVLSISTPLFWFRVPLSIRAIKVIFGGSKQ